MLVSKLKHCHYHITVQHWHIEPFVCDWCPCWFTSWIIWGTLTGSSTIYILTLNSWDKTHFCNSTLFTMGENDAKAPLHGRATCRCGWLWFVANLKCIWSEKFKFEWISVIIEEVTPYSNWTCKYLMNGQQQLALWYCHGFSSLDELQVCIF